MGKFESQQKKILVTFACCLAVALICGLFVFLKNSSLQENLLPNSTEGAAEKVEEENLIFQLSECKTYYTVVGLMHKHSQTISIPAECCGIPVKAIGENAFQGTDVVSIYIPDSVSEIGAGAFSGAESLQEVRLPENLKIIEESAFESCESLYRINVPENLMVIKGMAFAGCSSIKGMTIPESIVWVDTNAFYACTSLRYLQFEGYGLPWISDINVQTQCSIDTLNNSAIQHDGTQTVDPMVLELEQLLMNMPEIDENLQYLLGDKLTDSLSHKIYSFIASLLKVKQMYLLNDDLPAYVETVQYLRNEYGEPFVIEAIHRALDEVSNENPDLTLECFGSSNSLRYIQLGSRTFIESEDSKKEAANAYVQGCFNYFLDGDLQK